MDNAQDDVIYEVVRKRHHDLQERVRKLMSREGKLEKAISAAEADQRLVKDAIEKVVAAKVDPRELQEKASKLAAQLELDRNSLADIRSELILVREAMKWADIAHDALHWGHYADHKLAQFDRGRASAADNAELDETRLASSMEAE